MASWKHGCLVDPLLPSGPFISAMRRLAFWNYAVPCNLILIRPVSLPGENMLVAGSCVGPLCFAPVVGSG